MIYSFTTNINNQDCKKIQTNHLLTLCEVNDDYKSFCDDLEQLIKSKVDKDLIMDAYHAMQGKFFLGAKKYKEFIEKHKHTIETMNKYACLGNLTILSYDAKGNRKENLPLDYFYQYLQKHIEDIKTIKAVALKIKKLGFEKITFGEELDFTEMEYELNKQWGEIVYLENMEANPTYLNDPLKYKTNGSCYRIIFERHFLDNNRTISEYDKNIELNSLIFDPNRLPNELTNESTIGVISKLVEKKKEEYDDIRHSVDLSISTSDLNNYFEHLKSLTERINKIKDNEQLASLLKQMQEILTQLKLFGVDFENQVIESHPDITYQTMKREKSEYLRRRSLDGIDFD